jgi:signal transduction histidine kinase
VFAELHKKGRELERANRLLLAEVAERRRAEERLSELNESLDQRVTERTRELQASEARLREANRRKDEFLATLAHELRNPLAPVRNAVHFLKLRGPAGPTCSGRPT